MSASGGKPDIAYARICTGEMVNGTFISEASVSQVSDVKLAGFRLGACSCKDQALARVKRTSIELREMSAYDPKRISPRKFGAMQYDVLWYGTVLD
jgi:hypothetical protein